jgi:hypothetical protein
MEMARDLECLSVVAQFATSVFQLKVFDFPERLQLGRAQAERQANKERVRL